MLLIADAPNITTTHGRTRVRVGEMLAIQCIVEGFPPPTVSWTHNGTLLPECTLDLLNMLIVCAEFGDRERGDSSSSLLIISAKLSDTGRYECTAQNSAGVAVYEVYVAVERAISMRKFHSSDVRIALTHSLSLFLRSSFIPRLPCSSDSCQWIIDNTGLSCSRRTCSKHHLVKRLHSCQPYLWDHGGGEWYTSYHRC